MAATLAQKLQLKPDQPLYLLNPPEGYQAVLAQDLPANPLTTPEGSAQVGAVLLFVTSLEETRRLAPETIQQVDRQGLLWVAYPKGGSKIKTDVNRDRLWESLSGTGWRPVRMVALDDTWSAMRFRPEELVKGK